MKLLSSELGSKNTEYGFKQAVDILTNQYGWYIFYSEHPNCAISPIFDDAYDLSRWMTGSFELDPWGGAGFYNIKRLKRLKASEAKPNLFNYNLKPVSRVIFHPPIVNKNGNKITSLPKKVYDLVLKTVKDPLEIRQDDEFIQVVCKK